MRRNECSEPAILSKSFALEAYTVEDNAGSTVDRFFQLVLRKDWNKVSKWISQNRKDLKVPLHFRQNIGVEKCNRSVMLFPIHALCMQYDVPTKILLKVLSEDPEAAERQDTLGEAYPLHYACRYGTSATVLRWLIAAYPEAAKKKNKDGNLPLHLLCRCSSASLNYTNSGDQDSKSDSSNNLVDKAKLVLNAYSDAIFCLADKSGQKPLDLAKQRLIEYGTGKAGAQLRDLVCFLQGKEQMANSLNAACVFYKQCVICQSQDVSRVLIPCGHVSLCEGCSSNDCLSELRGKCPECREKFYCVQKVYGKIAQD